MFHNPVPVQSQQGQPWRIHCDSVRDCPEPVPPQRAVQNLTASQGGYSVTTAAGYTILHTSSKRKAKPPSLVLTSESHKALYFVLYDQDSTAGSLKIPHEQVELQQPKPTNSCTKSTMPRFQQNYVHGLKREREK